MRRACRWTSLWVVMVAMAPPLTAQGPPAPAPDRLHREPARDAVFAVRRDVLAELSAEVVAVLPEGHLAILPPEVPDPGSVDPAAAASWETAWAEELRRARGGVLLTERRELEAVLREQKFGDSPYADGGSAVEVGRIAAARSLLLTTLRELRPRGHEIRLHLEARLLDVETGEILWSRDVYRGLLPPWVRGPLAAAALLGSLPLLWLLRRFGGRWRRARLVRRTMPGRRARLRVDVDALARSVAAARERLFRSSQVAGAAAVQRASEDLEPVLDRVRHGLPGGAAGRGRARDLRRALRHVDRIGAIVRDLRRAADDAGDGHDLADRMGRSADDLRSTVDAYRGLLP